MILPQLYHRHLQYIPHNSLPSLSTQPFKPSRSQVYEKHHNTHSPTELGNSNTGNTHSRPRQTASSSPPHLGQSSLTPSPGPQSPLGRASITVSRGRSIVHTRRLCSIFHPGRIQVYTLLRDLRWKIHASGGSLFAVLSRVLPGACLVINSYIHVLFIPFQLIPW